MDFVDSGGGERAMPVSSRLWHAHCLMQRLGAQDRFPSRTIKHILSYLIMHIFKMNTRMIPLKKNYMGYIFGRSKFGY